MAYNKIIYDNQILVDLTEDTVTPETLLKGISAHDKTGAEIIGTLDFNAILAFEQCTCYQIQQIVTQGLASSLWAVGDKVPITLNGDVSTYTFDNETYYAFIIGFDHNLELETNGKHSLTLQFGKTEDDIDITFIDPNYVENSSSSATGFRMNTSPTSSGGWESCWMRNTICPAFYNTLPNDWQNIIGIIIKYQDNVGDGSDTDAKIWSTDEQIFLLAEYEIFGKRSYANSYEQNYQQQYDYYAAGNSKIKYRHFNTTAVCPWWNRSVYSSDITAFCIVDSRGATEVAAAIRSYGLTPAFTILE